MGRIGELFHVVVGGVLVVVGFVSRGGLRREVCLIGVGSNILQSENKKYSKSIKHKF